MMAWLRDLLLIVDLVNEILVMGNSAVVSNQSSHENCVVVSKSSSKLVALNCVSLIKTRPAVLSHKLVVQMSAMVPSNSTFPSRIVVV